MKLNRKMSATLALALLLVLVAATALASNYCQTCYKQMKIDSYIEGPYCQSKGKAYFVCPEGHKEVHAVNAAGHKWSRVTGEYPTCTEAGWQLVHCDRCNGEERQELKPKAHWYSTPWVSGGDGTHSSECRYGCGYVGTSACSMWIYDLSEAGACQGMCLVCGNQAQWASEEEALKAYPNARVMDLGETYAALTDQQAGFTKLRSCEGYLKLGSKQYKRDRFTIYAGSGAAEGILACVVNTLPADVTLANIDAATQTEPAVLVGGRGSEVSGDPVVFMTQMDNGTQAALVLAERSGEPHSLPNGLYVNLPVVSENADMLTLNLDLSKANSIAPVEAVLVVFPEASSGWNAKKN